MMCCCFGKNLASGSFVTKFPTFVSEKFLCLLCEASHFDVVFTCIVIEGKCSEREFWEVISGTRNMRGIFSHLSHHRCAEAGAM